MDETIFFQRFIQAIILLTFLQYGLFAFHHISLLNLIDDALIIILFITVLIKGIGGSKKIRIRGSKYDIIVFALIILSIASSILNKVSIESFLLGFKGYFLYFALFYSMIWIRFNETNIRDIFKFTLSIFFLEIVLAFIQLAIAVRQNTLTPDSIMGTFNGANYLGYSVFILLYLTIYEFYFNSNKDYLMYIVPLALLFIMSSARFAILLFLPLIIIINMDKLLKKIDLRKIIFFSLIVLATTLIVNPEFIGGGESITNLYKPGNIIKHFQEDENSVYSGSARNLWYPLTQYNLERYSYSPLIGFGLGAYGSFAAYTLMPQTNYLVYNYFNQIEKGLDADIDSQIIPIWGELGYFGIILIYIFLIAIIARMARLRKRTRDGFIELLASGTIAYAIFFTIGFYINHMLESQTTGLLFFMLLGATECLQPDKKDRKEHSKEHQGESK